MVVQDQRKIVTVADPAELAKTAADRLMARIAANDGRVAICLTGGSSPKQLYALLATDAYNKRIPFDRVHWFIGDERFVPPGDSRNNMTMARGIFLDRFAPASNIHPIPTDAANPDESAERYARELKSFYGLERLDPTRPLFDVVLMGVGPDGHTASIFPDYPALAERGGHAAGHEGDRGAKTLALVHHAIQLRSRCPPLPPAVKCCSRSQDQTSARS